MRLTLRTILAYLDDVLEPAQAREIGEKIAESKEAEAMMSRIREVIRRRRIGAPELAGPGSGPDPNMVSDYLENLLPADEVVELEKLCRASDVHLAEVAACHKILSLEGGQSPDVSDEIRERMYALGASRLPVEASEPEAVPAMAEGMTAVETVAETGLPEYLTRRTPFQKYRVVSLVVLVAILWVGLVWTDSALWSRQETVAVLNSDSELQSIPEGMVAGKPVEGQAPGVGMHANLPGREFVPPAPMPKIVSPAADPIIPAFLPVAPAMAAPEAGKPQAPAPAVVVPMPRAADIPDELPFIYQSGDEFVIKKVAAEAEWIVHSTDIPLELDDEIASPPTFRNTYGIDKIVDVSLEPMTRIRRLPRTDSTVLGLEFVRGQMTLFRPLTSKEPVSLDVLAANQIWTITLLEPGTRCAIELVPAVPTGPPDNPGLMSIGGGIVVVSGKIRISSNGQPEIDFTPGSGYARWPDEGTEFVLHADLEVPGWAQPEGVMLTPAARQLSRLFQKEFLKDRTISQCIGPVVKDRRAGISELAVQTLAMIDQYPFLVTALQSDHQESRLAAIQGLRQWLGKNAKDADRVREELGRTFRAENVEPIMRLLWGVSIDDAKNPEMSRKLIDWMKSDQVAIRELAFYYVSGLVGKTYDYLPMAPTTERRAAVGRWEDYLKRGEGTLLPMDPAEVSEEN